MTPRGSRRAVKTRRLPSTLLLLALLAVASAQPYAADGGFGEPVLVASGTLPVVSVAGEGGEAHVVWAEPSGVVARPLAGEEPAQVAASATVRGAHATVAGGELAVAWVERDRSTGQTHHRIAYRGEDHLLFTHTQETPLLVGPGAEGPWVVAALREEGEARLTLFVWEDGAPRRSAVLHATELAVRGAYALDDPDPDAAGPAYVAWLEGITEMTPLGLQSEWNAYVKPAASGAPRVDLGLADVVDERQTVALGRLEDGAVGALWRAQEANLQASLLAPAQDGGLEHVETVDVGEVGRPVAWAGSHAFWLEGPYLRRAAPFAGEAPVSVAWSPVLVAEADLTVAEPGGVVTLAWYGREQGGEVKVYASDDSAAFEPGFRDRVAAAMGWSPWSVWQEAAGQALTAVIVGMIAAAAFAPLLFLASVLLSRLPAVQGRPVAVGTVVGVVVPPLLAAVLMERVTGLAGLDAGALLGLLGALVVGGLIAYLVTRKADREAQLHVLVSSVVAVGIGLTVWSFAFYRTWAPFVGL